MTNYERIKSMSVEDIVKVLNGGCHCVYNDVCLEQAAELSFREYDCDEGTREWLEQEVDNGQKKQD